MKWNVMLSGFVRHTTDDLDDAIKHAVGEIKRLGVGIDKGPWIEIDADNNYVVKFMHGIYEVEGANIFK